MAHLTSFTVENFKRFEHFEMNNIGQFNLIVGDNNVGKTSVLEALLIINSAKVYEWRMKTVLWDFHHFIKPAQSYFTYFVNQNKLTWATDSIVVFRCLPDYEIQIRLDEESTQQGFKWLWIPYGIQGTQGYEEILDANNQMPSHKFIMPYIPFTNSYEHNLAEILQQEIYASATLEEQLVFDMKQVIPQLKSFRISTIHSEIPVLVVSQNGLEPSLPLASFGDGTIKLFRILIEIIRNSQKRLMIDEIDAGVHISRFKDFWRTILKASVTHNVQLFATTHNLECLQVFKEVLEEPEMVQYQEKARCFTLIDSKVTQRVEAVCSTFAEFENAIETNTEIRGGAVV